MSGEPRTDEMYLPLLKVDSSQINRHAIVCGDPARAAAIAARLEDAEELGYNREYRLFNGWAGPTPVTVVSHGVGAAGAAVCFEELVRGGVQEIIRVGTAGSLAPHRLRDGDLVVGSAAVRKDGLTDQLVAPEYPAVADATLTRRLTEAARERREDAAEGLILTVGAFFPGVEELPNNYFSKAGVLAVEMEAAALYVISSLHGIAAAGIFAIDGIAVDFDAEAYNPHREVVSRAIEDSMGAALAVFQMR